MDYLALRCTSSKVTILSKADAFRKKEKKTPLKNNKKKGPHPLSVAGRTVRVLSPRVIPCRPSQAIAVTAGLMYSQKP